VTTGSALEIAAEGAAPSSRRPAKKAMMAMSVETTAVATAADQPGRSPGKDGAWARHAPA
jgi:hypothetical protein